MRVIGVCGKAGSGKDTVARYIRNKYGYKSLTMHSVVAEETKKLGLLKTRRNLQTVAQTALKKDKYFWLKRMANKIGTRKSGNFVISGVRLPHEDIFWKKYAGKDFHLIFVNADRKLRFQRMKKRGSARDTKNWLEFLKNDKREEEIFHSSRLFRMADYKVINDDGLAALYRQIDCAMRGIK